MNIHQILLGAIVGGASAAAFYSRAREEEKLTYGNIKPGRKTCLIEPLMLPLVLAVLFSMLILTRSAEALTFAAARLGLLFLHISSYYAVLLIALPLLRKIISAMACAALWLAPTLLYFFIWLTGHEMRPLFVITLPRRYLAALMIVWASGFALVALWQLLSHLRFRSVLLRGAEDFDRAAALALWRNELKRHGVKADIPILVSGMVNTPLTIGCFDRSMRLILPKLEYSDGELKLIYRHELRHILRCDTRAKLFLGFCAAMCWFNPLAWVARRKVADDLELSCDEAILSGAGPEERKQYAELLLKSAGNGRGYTTCLSSAASTLRYRLRNALHPRERLSGGFCVGFTVLALILTFGAAALADGPDSARAAIFDRAPSGLVADRVSVYHWPDGNQPDEVSGYSRVYGYDEAALTEYISSLRVRQVYAGNYPEEKTRQLYVDYAEVANGEIASLTRVELSDNLLFVNIPYDDSGTLTYLLDDAPDWEYIRSLLDFDAPDPNPSPRPPDLTFSVTDGAEHILEGPIYAAKKVKTLTDVNGIWFGEYSEGKTELRLLGQGGESAPSRYIYDSGGGVGGCFGLEVRRLKLAFSYAPADYTVLVENWDRSECYTLSSDDLEDNALPAAPYSAHYTVRGSFDTISDTHYEMEFYFDIGLPADSRLWEGR